MSTKTWLLLDILNKSANWLKKKEVENPRLNAEHLLANILNVNRMDLYLKFERPLSEQETNRYRELLKRRVHGEPLQHILGTTAFMGLHFQVNSAVLIPRPETELLVEKVLELKSEGFTNPTILDVGTGSGCIAVSLAKLMENATVLASDISKKAIEIAFENAKQNGLASAISTNNELAPQRGKATFYVNNFLDNSQVFYQYPIEILVSNPPYIRNDEMAELPPEVRDYEPHRALTDFADGLEFYRYFFTLIAEKKINTLQYAFFEMSGSQPQKIIQLAKNMGIKKCFIYEDFNHIPRILKIKAAND
jgi:release factor glutamine methyltransferase